MKLFLILANFYFAYTTANSSSNVVSSSIEDKQDAKIHFAVKQLMTAINEQLQNPPGEVKRVALSKRNYPGYYSPFMNNYYQRAYGIVRTGCTGGNPHLYRPAPGGGYYRPISNRFYKRQGRIDHEIDGIAENAKIIQKQLAVAWKEELSKNTNSLSRRATYNSLTGFIADSYSYVKTVVKNIIPYGDDAIKKAPEPTTKNSPSSSSDPTNGGPITSSKINDPATVDPNASGKINDPTAVDQNASGKINDPATVDPNASGKINDPATVDPNESGNQGSTPSPHGLTGTQPNIQIFKNVAFYIGGSAIVLLILVNVLKLFVPAPSYQENLKLSEVDGIRKQTLGDDISFG